MKRGAVVLMNALGNAVRHAAHLLLLVPWMAAAQSYVPPSNQFIEQWRLGGLGSRIGNSGLAVADFDRDGRTEIFGSASTYIANWPADHWFVLEYSAATGAYEKQWMSGLQEADIWRTAAIEVDPTGPYQLIVSYTSGRAEVYDGATYSLEAVLDDADTGSVYGDPIGLIVHADVDGDGQREVVLCGTEAFVYDPSTWRLEQRLPFAIVGLFDGALDSGVEETVFVSESGALITLTPDTHTVRLQANYWLGGFNVYLDVTGDGLPEAIGPDGFDPIKAYDLASDAMVPGWSLQRPGGGDSWVMAATSGDIDGDGFEEYLFGEHQGSAVYGYNVAAGDPDLGPGGAPTRAWSIDGHRWGTSEILIADSDDDGDAELIVAAGWYQEAADQIYIYDLATQALEWTSSISTGPYHAVAVGDVDEDGREEVVYLSQRADAGTGDGVLLIADAETGTLEYEGSPFEKLPLTDSKYIPTIATQAHAVAVGDVDGDGQVEILVGTDSLYVGALYVIDGRTRRVKSLYLFDRSVPIMSLALYDFDHDGVQEIIAGGIRWGTDGEGSYLYEIDGRDGSVVWRIDAGLSFFSGFGAVRVGDVTGDGRPEIVALSEVPDYPNPRAIYVIDRSTREAIYLRRDGLTGLDLVDADADGVLDVLVSTGDGKLLGFNGTDLHQIYEQTIGATPAWGVRSLPDVERGESLVVFGHDTMLVVFDLHAGEQWRSGRLSSAGFKPVTTPLEAHNAIFTDLDPDDRPRIVAGLKHLVVALHGPAAASTSTETPDQTDKPVSRHSAVYPNPASNLARLDYLLEESAQVRLEVFDVQGRSVALLIDRQHVAGSHSITWQVEGWTPGLYIVRLRTPHLQNAFTFVVQR